MHAITWHKTGAQWSQGMNLPFDGHVEVSGTEVDSSTGAIVLRPLEHVVDDDTIALYHLNEESYSSSDSSCVQDASGNGYHGTVIDAVTSDVGALRRHAVVDANGAIVIPYVGGMLTPPFTIDFWAKQDASGDMLLLDARGDSYSGIYLKTVDGYYHLFIGNGTEWVEIGSTWLAPDRRRDPTEWQHIAVVCSASNEFGVYVDGSRHAVTTVDDYAVPTTLSSIYFGRSADGNETFQGRFDELRFSSVARWSGGAWFDDTFDPRFYDEGTVVLRCDSVPGTGRVRIIDWSLDNVAENGMLYAIEIYDAGAGEWVLLSECIYGLHPPIYIPDDLTVAPSDLVRLTLRSRRDRLGTASPVVAWVRLWTEVQEPDIEQLPADYVALWTRSASETEEDDGGGSTEETFVRLSFTDDAAHEETEAQQLGESIYLSLACQAPEVDSATHALYRFEEEHWTTDPGGVLDSGPGHWHGQAGDSVDTCRFGWSGRCGLFMAPPGISVRLPDEAIPTTTEYTIEMWVRGLPLINNTYPVHPFFIEYAATFILGFALYPPYGRMRFKHSDEHSYFWLRADTVSVLDGQWHHIAASVSEDFAYLFLDGEIVAQRSPGAAGPPAVTRPVWIGGERHTVYSMRGLIDEFRISSIARYTEPFEPRRYLAGNTSLVIPRLTSGTLTALNWSAVTGDQYGCIRRVEAKTSSGWTVIAESDLPSGVQPPLDDLNIEVRGPDAVRLVMEPDDTGFATPLIEWVVAQIGDPQFLSKPAASVLCTARRHDSIAPSNRNRFAGV